MKYDNIHLMRWEEIPDFPLYIDQVIGIIEKSLDFLKMDDDDKIITSTMINNYVKHKLVFAPSKKKYVREHIAYFIVICLLKKVYSLDEISKLIKIQFDHAPVAKAYNDFCDLFEAELKGIDSDIPYIPDEKMASLFIKTIKSVVYAIDVQRTIHNELTVAEAKKEKEKEK